MHFRSWLFVTSLTLLLTGFVISRAGWLSDRSAGRRIMARAHATAQDLFASESGARFRNAEVRHWKSLVLKH